MLSTQNLKKILDFFVQIDYSVDSEQRYCRGKSCETFRFLVDKTKIFRHYLSNCNRKPLCFVSCNICLPAKTGVN